MACGCEWTKNIKILAARARVSTTFDTATRATGGETRRRLRRYDVLRGARVDLGGLAFEGESRDGLVGLGRDVEEFDGFRRRFPDRDVLPFRIRGEVVQGRRLLVLAAT